MYVYVLVDEHEEGLDILGVFSSEEKANQYLKDQGLGEDYYTIKKEVDKPDD